MWKVVSGSIFIVVLAGSASSDGNSIPGVSVEWMGSSGVNNDKFRDRFLGGLEWDRLGIAQPGPAGRIYEFSDDVKDADWFKNAFDRFQRNEVIDYNELFRNFITDEVQTTPEEEFLERIQLEMISRGRLGQNVFGLEALDYIQIESLDIDEPKTNSEIFQAAPKIYSEGAIFGNNFLTPRVSAGQLQQWYDDPNAPVDLQQFGLPEPSGPIDVYILSNSFGAPSEVILQPHGVPLTKLQKEQLLGAENFKKRLAQWGGNIYSSVQDAIAATVETVCKSAFRPEEFTIELGGEGSVFVASLAAKITAKFTSDDVCAPFAG